MDELTGWNSLFLIYMHSVGHRWLQSIITATVGSIHSSFSPLPFEVKLVVTSCRVGQRERTLLAVAYLLLLFVMAFLTFHVRDPPPTRLPLVNLQPFHLGPAAFESTGENVLIALTK